MKKNVEYVRGDATAPQGEGHKLIIHCCNDIGAWGAGFVVALSKKWPYPETKYREWAKSSFEQTLIDGRTVTLVDGVEKKNASPFVLGMIQAVGVETDIAVVNMIGQHKTGPDEYGFPPIRYWAIDECLKKVAVLAKKHKCSVHGPRFGAGLAGGEWDYIELMLTKRLVHQGIPVTVYDFADVRV